MATKYWIKVYHEVLDDPKAGKLPDNLWRRFFECCLLAGEMGFDDDDPQNGRLPPTSDMSWRLRVIEETLIEELTSLARKGMLEYRSPDVLDGYWFVTNFNERQRKMDKAEYMRRLRQERAGVTSPLPARYQPVTDGHADIDKDIDVDTDGDEDIRLPVTIGNRQTYIHPDSEPIANIKTAISAISKTTQWVETEEAYDSAAHTLVGWDATPADVERFGIWWRENGYYPGKPTLKSIMGEWQNFAAGVQVGGNGHSRPAILDLVDEVINEQNERMAKESG